jgi:serine/threonine protein kinase
MKKRGTLSRGQVIDDTYHILFYIGEGAFGEVYRVHHKYLGTQVLKLFKENNNDKDKMDEMVREARVLSKIMHANIVRVFECNAFILNDQTRYFMTMGFVSGENLTQLLIRRINLTAKEAVIIILDVLSGLNYVHSMTPPIIHRDINADNILLSYEGEGMHGMLSDFGLAQTLDIKNHLPNAAGRYTYMAPECFWGAYVLSSDVFSAGVTLYRAITGIHPWQYELEWVGHDVQDMVTRITSARKRPPKAVSFYAEDSDDSLDAIISKAISIDLQFRYRCASDFFGALKLWLDTTSSDF